MSESTLTLKKAIPIIAVTWILSLITTLAVVYVEPNLLPRQNQTASQNQIEIIRFNEPSEKNITGFYLWLNDVATFVWTPKNPTSNSILALYCYFEYRCDNPEEYVWDWEGAFWWMLQLGMIANDCSFGDFGEISRTASSQAEWEEKYSTEWKQICLVANIGILSGTADSVTEVWITPNQNNYTLKLGAFHSDRASSSTPTFVRNINVIIEVIDGLPSAT